MPGLAACWVAGVKSTQGVGTGAWGQRGSVAGARQGKEHAPHARTCAEIAPRGCAAPRANASIVHAPVGMHRQQQALTRRLGIGSTSASRLSGSIAATLAAAPECWNTIGAPPAGTSGVDSATTRACACSAGEQHPSGCVHAGAPDKQAALLRRAPLRLPRQPAAEPSQPNLALCSQG